jgi:putative phage-type endonuclease
MNAPIVATLDRSRYLGSSDVAAVLGISPWKSAVQLWLDKIEPKIEDKVNVKAKARGTRLEPYIRDMVAEEYGVKIVRFNERYQDPEVEFFAAEIDAETDDGENVEIKTVHPFRKGDWGAEMTDELPLHYAAQVQFALGVKARVNERMGVMPPKLCRVYALIGDDLKQYVIERDDETIHGMRQQCADFWIKHVVGGVQPALDVERPDVLDVIKKLYPGTSGEVLPASEAHKHWRYVLETANRMRKHYDEISEGVRAHLLAEMKDATAIEFDDGQSFIRKVIKTREYVVAAKVGIDCRLGKLKAAA